MDKARSEKIIQTLNKKGANKPCPRCGNLHFNVVAETTIPINNDPNGNIIPIVLVACTNCGFVTQHALGALGLVPVEDSVEEFVP